MSENQEKLVYERPVVLAGSADLDFQQLAKLTDRGFALIAADGGANALLEQKVIPEAIIGDFDSLDQSKCQGKNIRLLQFNEQDTTDFEKCLYSVRSPIFLALGFTGKRFDHTMAALHVMVKFHGEKRVLLMSGSDISFVQRGKFSIPGEDGQNISIYPLAPIDFERSEGLKYPLDGLTFDIGSRVGTSNLVTNEKVLVVPTHECMDTPYLVSVSNGALDEFLRPFS